MNKLTSLFTGTTLVPPFLSPPTSFTFHFCTSNTIFSTPVFFLLYRALFLNIADLLYLPIPGARSLLRGVWTFAIYKDAREILLLRGHKRNTSLVGVKAVCSYFKSSKGVLIPSKVSKKVVIERLNSQSL